MKLVKFHPYRTARPKPFKLNGKRIELERLYLSWRRSNSSRLVKRSKYMKVKTVRQQYHALKKVVQKLEAKLELNPTEQQLDELIKKLYPLRIKLARLAIQLTCTW
jgi:hypothetical protein